MKTHQRLEILVYNSSIATEIPSIPFGYQNHQVLLFIQFF